MAAVVIPPAVLAEITAIGEPSCPEGGRLRKLQARAVAAGASPDELLSWQLAGIAADPVAYRRFDARLTQSFANQSNLNYPSGTGAAPEVILGSGYHAAVLAAARNCGGYGKPLVLESSGTVGGVFAVSQNPSFYLNSESSGGLPGAPWDGRAHDLNWLPGGPVQAAQISGREIPDNTVLRFCVRAALIVHARVITRAHAIRVRLSADSGYLSVELRNGRTIRACRVFDARGMGPDAAPARAPGRVLSWSQAMAAMDTDFPFEQMRRVAVIGDGKSALCAAEALLGIGPDATLRSHAAGGLPAQVDLFGPKLPQFREQWQAQLPGRYLRLGSHLPTGEDTDDDGDTVPGRGYGLYHDLTVRAVPGYPAECAGGVLVNGRFYDAAVVCTGHDTPPGLLSVDYAPFSVGGREVARKADGVEYYQAGPVADLPWTPADYATGIQANPENRVAMHRLGPLTAILGTIPQAAP